MDDKYIKLIDEIYYQIAIDTKNMTQRAALLSSIILYMCRILCIVSGMNSAVLFYKITANDIDETKYLYN